MRLGITRASLDRALSSRLYTWTVYAKIGFPPNPILKLSDGPEKQEWCKINGGYITLGKFMPSSTNLEPNVQPKAHFPGTGSNGTFE